MGGGENGVKGKLYLVWITLIIFHNLDKNLLAVYGNGKFIELINFEWVRNKLKL